MKIKQGIWAVVFQGLSAIAGADVITGTVMDSASGKPLYHVKVGSDAAHFVLTDSAGAFSFNTDQVSGVLRRDERDAGRISWNPEVGGFFLPVAAGVFTPEIRNIQGRLLRGYRPEIATPHAANSGAAKTSARAAVTLKFTKPSFYPHDAAFPGSQSNVVVRLQEDFSPTRHDYLTAAEWQCNNGDCENKQKMYIVRGGKIVWTYTEPLPAEFDDAWMLSDGSILMSLRYGARKIKSTENPATSWYIHEDIKTQGEIHVAQPLGLTKALIWINEGNKSTALIMNTVTGDTLRRINVPSGNGGFHGGGRHARITRDGTLMVAHFDLNKVAEYDTATMKEVWSYSGHAWTAVKLRNGNVLLSGDGAGWVREISRATKQIVWEVNVKDLPDVRFGQYIQGIQRLVNGNTIINNHNGSPGILEVGPDKKVVWSVPTSLIPLSSTVQILGEEGVPENPGDLLR